MDLSRSGGLAVGVLRCMLLASSAAALLFALGSGSAVSSASAATVLSQDWTNGLKSEIPVPSTVDPLTGKDDQWLVFSGGYPGIGGFTGAQEPGQGTQDTETVGSDEVGGWPASSGFYRQEPGGTVEEAHNTPTSDRHDLWHVQSNPQNIAINPFISENLVSLPGGDDGRLPSPPNGSNIAWFGSESSGTFCGTENEVEANAENQPGSDNGCQTPEDAEELPLGGAGFGDTVEEGELVSPPFSLVGAQSALLSFKSWFEVEAVEANLFDIMEIDYTTDAGTKTDPFKWQVAGTLNPEDDTAGAPYTDYSDEGQNVSPSWQPILVDLGDAIGSPHVRVRFVFDTWDILYNGFRGWLVDDVSAETPSAAGTPSVTGVDVCSGTSVAPITVIHGSNFFVGSTVEVDGIEQPGQTPSSTRVEIPAIEAGVHTIQILDPDGGAVSNVFTVNQPASCEPPSATTSTTVTPTSTPTPSPPPPVIPPPATAPPIKGKLSQLKGGELVEEDEFPEAGEVEDLGEVSEGASLASFRDGPFSELSTTATAKCKKGFVRKLGRCVNNKPVVYGHDHLHVTTAGKYKLRIKPSARVLAALTQGKALHVKLTLVFTPTGTSDHIRSVRYITVRVKKKHT
jgi:hypothetical protein